MFLFLSVRPSVLYDAIIDQKRQNDQQSSKDSALGSSALSNADAGKTIEMLCLFYYSCFNIIFAVWIYQLIMFGPYLRIFYIKSLIAWLIRYNFALDYAIVFILPFLVLLIFYMMMFANLAL